MVMNHSSPPFLVAWGLKPNVSQTEKIQKKINIQELGSNMRYNTTLGDDNPTKELVQLLVVADGELQVARNDTRIANVSMITYAKRSQG